MRSFEVAYGRLYEEAAVTARDYAVAELRNCQDSAFWEFLRYLNIQV